VSVAQRSLAVHAGQYQAGEVSEFGAKSSAEQTSKLEWDSRPEGQLQHAACSHLAHWGGCAVHSGSGTSGSSGAVEQWSSGSSGSSTQQ